MKIYLVRHGQTDWNVRHLAQGRTDIPLNETGRRQAMELRDKVRELHFDVCYSSPLTRALETAKIVTDDSCEIIVDDLITERCFGELEGTSSPPNWMDYWTLGYVGDAEGMESLADVFARTKKFLDRLRDEYNDDARILVVGHGGALKTLHFNIVGYDEKTDFLAKHFENGELWEYEL